MKFIRSALAFVGVLASTSVLVASASTPPRWLAARIAALPADGTSVPQGYLPALSCPSAGNCAAAGDYAGAGAVTKGLLLNEVGGVWRQPTAIIAPPGAGANPGTTPYGISCGSPGNCVVAGSYQNAKGSVLGFVDEAVAERWRPAAQALLPANALRSKQNAQIRAVVCSSPGNCSASGVYLDHASPAPRTQGFVLNEVHGVWGRGAEVRLPTHANFNPLVSLGQMACASLGNCVATGSYIDDTNATQGLIVDEVRGAWQAGRTLTLPGNANAYPGASLSSTACPAAGTCTAIGTYENATGAIEGLTVSESAGAWGRAVPIALPPGAATNPHVFLYGFGGISCANAANCSTGGQYRDGAGLYQGFFVSEVHGVWRNAVELTLPRGALQVGRNGGVVAISCVGVGSCSAGAAYLDAANAYQALTVDEVNGVWLPGIKVVLPRHATSVGVAGGVYGLLCAHNGQCTAIGSYQRSATVYQGMTIATK